MPFLNWNDKSHGVGIDRFDREHQKLFGMINELHDAMRAGKGRTVVSGILHRLADYTVEHFTAEEAAMRATNYPDFAAHRAAHKKLTDQVAEYAKQLDAGNTTITIDLMNFLRDWLEKHIVQTDRRYRGHLESHPALQGTQAVR